jgi:hypothetical protein
MANAQNLGPPWRLGESGNPNGRPKENLITDAARNILQEPHPRSSGTTRAEVIARRWVRPAEKDTKDLNALLDRTEGKVPEAESQHGIDLESIAILMETLGDDSDSAQGGEESPQIPESAPTE